MAAALACGGGRIGLLLLGSGFGGIREATVNALGHGGRVEARCSRVIPRHPNVVPGCVGAFSVEVLMQTRRSGNELPLFVQESSPRAGIYRRKSMHAAVHNGCGAAAHRLSLIHI